MAGARRQPSMAKGGQELPSVAMMETAAPAAAKVMMRLVSTFSNRKRTRALGGAAITAPARPRPSASTVLQWGWKKKVPGSGGAKLDRNSSPCFTGSWVT